MNLEIVRDLISPRRGLGSVSCSSYVAGGLLDPVCHNYCSLSSILASWTVLTHHKIFEMSFGVSMTPETDRLEGTKCDRNQETMVGPYSLEPREAVRRACVGTMCISHPVKRWNLHTEDFERFL